MANSNNSFKYPVFHPDLPSSSTYIQQPLPINNNYNPQPSLNQNNMQQPMPNLEDITDPTAAIYTTIALMVKAFKLNYSTPTNNNQRISSNPQNRQITQPGMNLGQDNQMGNQFRQYAGQNVRNQNRNGNVVEARAEGNVNGNNASTSGTQTNKAPVYDSDGSPEEQYTNLLKPIPDPHEVQHNDSNVISKVSSMEQGGGTIDQHPETSVYQEKCLTKKIHALHLNSAKTITTLNAEIANLNNQLSKEKSTVSSLQEEKKKLKSDFKIRKDELLDKQIQL
ncbi:hypothetical protein Tco_0916806 [Tanacetum coccineum]